MYYDLHTHTVCSDGRLTPEALVATAAGAGVRVLAVTDHDTVDGLVAARAAAVEHGVRVVTGVEVSVSWEQNPVHIVGLDFDVDDAALAGGLAAIREIRRQRGRLIAERLAAAGLHGVDEVLKRPAVIGRGHFAQWIVEKGYATSSAKAFRRFLRRGQPGYVPVQWPPMAQAVEWLRAAGACVVLAHPSRYPLSSGRLRQLIRAFVNAGGDALEVVTAGFDVGEIGRLGSLASQFGLLASAGSDFHGILPWRSTPGNLPDLPPGCVGVWRDRPAMQVAEGN